MPFQNRKMKAPLAVVTLEKKDCLGFKYMEVWSIESKCVTVSAESISMRKERGLVP